MTRPDWCSRSQHHFEKVTETKKAPVFLPGRAVWSLKCGRGGEIRPGWRSSSQHRFEKVTETIKATVFLPGRAVWSLKCGRGGEIRTPNTRIWKTDKSTIF